MVQKHSHPLIFRLCFDNINIPFHVFLQYVDNQSNLGHGIAATVYIKHDASKHSKDLNWLLKEQWAERIKNPLTKEDILNLEQSSASHINKQMKHIAFCMLLNSPEFDMKTYDKCDSEAFKAPHWSTLSQLGQTTPHCSFSLVLQTKLNA